MFSHLDSRFKQIFSNVDASIGGVSVIVFGDLFQPPSHDPNSAIFGSYLWSPFKFF